MIRLVISVAAVGIAVPIVSALAQQAATPRPFYASDSPSPWPYTDWAPGDYKAQCSSGGPTMGLSALGPVSGSGGAPGGGAQAHSTLCKSPNSGSFPFSDTSGSPSQVQTFYSSDSAGYGARGDWDHGFYKGECSQGFVIGVAQRTDRRMDKILCSYPCIDDGMSASTNINNCTVRTFPGDNPSGLPDGNWDPGSYKLACDPGKVMVGISSYPVSHNPHAILCCSLSTLVC
jgi:hypothetical protein